MSDQYFCTTWEPPEVTWWDLLREQAAPGGQILLYSQVSLLDVRNMGEMIRRLHTAVTLPTTAQHGFCNTEGSGAGVRNPVWFIVPHPPVLHGNMAGRYNYGDSTK